MARAWSISEAGVRRAIFAALVALLPALVSPNAATADGGADRTPTVVRPAGAIMVPEKFLRRWDPITIFFEQDTGPAEGGAEDDPKKFVTLVPAHAGAATWLNARTLQFFQWNYFEFCGAIKRIPNRTHPQQPERLRNAFTLRLYIVQAPENQCQRAWIPAMLFHIAAKQSVGSRLRARERRMRRN